MTALLARNQEQRTARLATRNDLTGFFRRIDDEIGAESYMLVAILHDQDRSDVRIIASNWIYDAIEFVGKGLVANIAQSAYATAAGARPRSIQAVSGVPVMGVLSGNEAGLLEENGHGELYCLKLDIGRQRLFALFSAGGPGRIGPDALRRAQMQCSYALSQVPELLAAAAFQDPLSDRERECLYWVSEGKTTDEVAVILGVSSNTVNSYIAHAIQKFAASNRAMAIATAIRSGII